MSSAAPSAAASAAFEQAEDHFKDENFSAASKCYDEAVSLCPSNARFLSARAFNRLKLKEYPGALADAEASLAIEPSNGRSQLRRGLALFYLDRFSDALEALQAAKAGGQDKTDIWIRKCQAELSRLSSPAVVATASAPAAVVHKVTSLPAPAPAEKPAPVLPKPPANLAERTREQWFQSPQDVTVTLLAKGLTKEQVSISFDEASNKLTAKLTFPTDSSAFERTWALFGHVAGQPTIAITPYKVELVFAKAADDSTTWDTLERVGDAPVAPIVKRENVQRDDMNYAAYPTSAKVAKNWEEVEQAAVKAEAEEKPEGEAALQKLFQSIYGGADEDTKRAMIKSFQTSGGTVLSTNWKEVQGKDYEKDREAPKGQEMKDWNSKERGSA